MTRQDSSGSVVRPAFRADVQGLRAVAVLIVIAGHAGVPFLAGGFVGVDVFFVISGFLISSLLFREVVRDGKVSLADFYARRARRILPAATLVTLITLVGSIIWLSIVDSLKVVTDALWVTFFAANVRFSSVGTDYFSQAETPSPLQHYWSLAVEEQFYVVWPLILIACLLVVRRYPRRTGAGAGATKQSLPGWTILGVLIGLGVASFAYGVHLTTDNRTAAYFSTPARAWELAVGAVTALVAHAVARRMASRVRGLLALSGLGAIAAACALYDQGTAFPGTAALLPVLGSAAVLLAGAGGHQQQPLPIRALTVRPMRVVGDWSYSLYLWHWPLLIIPEVSGGRSLSPLERGVLVALTFVLAGLTYRFVETPFRSPARVPRPRALLLYPVSAAVVAIACVGGTYLGHYRSGEYDGNPAISVSNFGVPDESAYDLDPDPTVALMEASVIAARHDMAVPSKLAPGLLDLQEDIPGVGSCDYDHDSRNVCPRGDPDGDKSLVVFGNSHGRMWIPAFERIAEHEGYRTYYFVKPNCTGAMLTVSDVLNNNEPWTACDDFRAWALDRIADIRPDLTVVSTSGPTPYIYLDNGDVVREDSADRMKVERRGFRDTFEALTPLSDRVVLLRDVPKSTREPDICLTNGDVNLGDCLFKPMENKELDAKASVQAARRSGIEYYNPTKWLCYHQRCPVVIGDVLPYRDASHISTTYSNALGDDIGRAMGIWTDDTVDAAAPAG